MQPIPKGIPWDKIGPAEMFLIIVLVVVLGFLLRWRKATKPVAVPNNPGNYPCMDHTEGIATNKANIGSIEKSVNLVRTDNSKAHDKIFKKLDTMQTDIIKAINGGKR